ncbi:hypothetical protein [Paenibacillus sp. TH7-28]
MAGIAKPSIDNLHPEISIQVVSCNKIYSNSTQVTNDPSVFSRLFDGSTSKLGSYGSIMMYSGCSFEFVADEPIEYIWALGNTYSDSSGSTPKDVKLEMLKNGVYELIGTYPTKSDGTWYQLFGKLDKGQYRVTGTASYTEWDEWYVGRQYYSRALFSMNDNIFSFKDELMIKLPAFTEENFINYGIEMPFNIPIGKKIKEIIGNSQALGSGKTFEHTIDLSKSRVDKINLN